MKEILAKRKIIQDRSCLICSKEVETTEHPSWVGIGPDLSGLAQISNETLIFKGLQGLILGLRKIFNAYVSEVMMLNLTLQSVLLYASLYGKLGINGFLSPKL